MIRIATEIWSTAHR